ncbi:MAG: helical backbone metal receptor [Rhodothalassiaceae bacterium]
MIDQLGRRVAVPAVPAVPRRIVSLCPSTTETVIALAGADRLVGRTAYCTRPADTVAAIAEVGGTKTVDVDAVARLNPDLIVSVREENDRSQIDALAQRFATIVLDPIDIDTMLAAVRLIGQAVGQAAAGADLAQQIDQALSRLAAAGQQRVLYLIWRKPFMAAGAGTYIDALLRRLGLLNAAAQLPGRYPALTAASITAVRPAIVLAASEPFPFKAKHLVELEAVFGCPALLVDGEAFGWHGVRLLQAVTILRDTVRDIAARTAAAPVSEF